MWFLTVTGQFYKKLVMIVERVRFGNQKLGSEPEKKRVFGLGLDIRIFVFSSLDSGLDPKSKLKNTKKLISKPNAKRV